MASYSPRIFLLALFIFAIVLSPALPSDAAKSTNHRDDQPMNKPYCPACNCCKAGTVPPPCCYCACFVTTSQPDNATP
ncbi:hypothetical protein Vadar_032101 [Vaccinium darrowii]|uniref:Uncharacterized protein n=1 Tax=Vaccinium darrowii TaxID=229202 RepID=A0ACB7ZN67_9ERIC|nr:hypothetical protein Vadar_032101 [Vaccinium darrowii]